MYTPPTLRVLEKSAKFPKPSAGTGIIVLLAEGEAMPKGVPALPSHLKKHPAARGERFAKLVIQGRNPVILAGVGNTAELTPQDAAELGEHLGRSALDGKISEVQVKLSSKIKDARVAWNLAKGLAICSFKIDELKSKAQPSERLKSVLLGGFNGALTSDILISRDLPKIRGLAKGQAFARELSDLPPSRAFPQGVVDRFTAAAAGSGLKIEAWDEKKIAKEGMGLLHAVGRASATQPRFLVVRYDGGEKDAKSLYLVGKGVTFDTGGINLKVGDWKMLAGMKRDMSGAASVLGAMLAVAAMKPKANVVGITPLAVNAIDSNAVLPSDIVTSYSGKTVEIQNTDAEGRLILADALHFAIQEKADYVVDVATLTGACMIALGSYHSGLFSNNPAFQERLRQVSEDRGEPAWPMPMSRRYGDELKSQLADLANMGKGRDGGAILGAKFLEAFVGKTPWCHLDIAGTEENSAFARAGSAVESAGRMVDTLSALAEDIGLNG